MSKKHSHYIEEETVGKIALTIAIGLIVLISIVFLAIPQLEPVRVFIGKLFCSIRGNITINPYKEEIQYAQTFLITVISLAPLIICVWLLGTCFLDDKVRILLFALSFILMLAADVLLIAIPGSPLRGIPTLVQLKEETFIIFRVDHVARFNKNFCGLYMLYAYPFILQAGLFALISFILKEDDRSVIAYILFAFLVFAIPYLGTFLFFCITCLISVLIIVAVCFIPVSIVLLAGGGCYESSEGNYSDDSSSDSSGGFFGSYPKGMKAGYDSADHPVYHDGKGGYVTEDGRPYNGIVHCFRD